MNNFKTKPMQHQMDCYSKSWTKPYFALFCDMGTGKTKVTIDTMCHFFEQKKIENVMILCPKALIATWKAELRKHANLAIKVTQYNKKGFELLNRDESLETLPLAITNIDALDSPNKYTWVDHQITDKTLFIIDESTRIKSPKAARSKMALKLSKKTNFKRILTGYPMPKNTLDLYNQLKFLDESLVDGHSYYSFRNTFCKIATINLGPQRPSFTKITGAQNQSYLDRLIGDYCFKINKEDCLELKGKTYIKKYYELTPKQVTYYEGIVKDLFLSIDETDLIFASAVAAVTKLQQICSGFLLYKENEEDKNNKLQVIEEVKDNPKLQLLKEIVESLLEEDKKVVIWATFQQTALDIENCLKSLFKKPEENIGKLNGTVPQKLRDEYIEQFQTGKLSILICNQQTAAFGITLTASHNVIYYNNSYNLEERLQSEDRVYRLGQNENCTYYDLCASEIHFSDTSIHKSIETNIFKNLKEKRKIGDLFMNKTILKEFF